MPLHKPNHFVQSEVSRDELKTRAEAAFRESRELTRQTATIRSQAQELRQRKEVAQRQLAEEQHKTYAELLAKFQQRSLELTVVNKRLKQSLVEKEILLKEIHHRVKNNLQVISSLLQLQAQHIKDKQSAEMFRESQNRVRAMALVHERLYHSEDLANVDLTAYIKSLANHLLRSYQIDQNLIKLYFDVHEVHLGIDAAVPCGLILNELVSNCLKHAFPNGEGEIRIELDAASASTALLSVSDNGVGLPDNLEVHTANTFGMRLLTALVDQLRGSLAVGRTAGTMFSITFPLGR